MKRTLIMLASILLIIKLNGQEASVEKSVKGVQFGLIGFWAFNEIRLSKKIALRAELGLDGATWNDNYSPSRGAVLLPIVTIEPRWYYNLEKRKKKSKDISNNGGNFLAIQTSYTPDWFTITKRKNVRVIEQISIIPTWGIKRNINKHIGYEVGFGLGYRKVFEKGIFSSLDANLHLRIGYQF